MPTRYFELTDTNAHDLIVPPAHRKVVITMLRLKNTGTSTVTVTLSQISPDGNDTKTVDKIDLPAGQEFGITLDSGAYDLERGYKLQGVLSAASTVRVAVTYKLE